MRRINIDKMMRKLGMKVEPVKDVERVDIVLKDGTILRVKGGEVAKIEVQGQSMFQIVGGEVLRLEAEEEEVPEMEVSEEDVELVAQQAGVDKETARLALVTVGGDLAKAIMMLRESEKRSQ